FCRRIKIPVLGVIENMSGLMCPHCGQMIDLFKSGGGEAMANKMDVPFLGRIPIDPRVVEASDLGEPFIERHADSEGAAAFARIVQQLIDLKA
ncbi:MAG: P-loop NTPase, partial [Syntrophorhabdaceae bacterium]